MKTARKAAPDEYSGLNPNTPIRIYDTHPNQRFEIGDQVLLIDFEEPRVLGRVIGHAAEDRVWIQWPHTVSQEDVDDIISTKEWAYGFLDDSDYRLKNRKRRANVEYTTGDEIENMDASISSGEHDEFHKILNAHLQEGGIDPDNILTIKDAVDQLSRDDQQELLDALSELDYPGPPTAGRKALMPRWMGGSGVPTGIGGGGTYEQQFQQQPGNYNPLRLPEVEAFLEKAGLARQDVQNFAGQYDKALESKTQKQNVQWEQMMKGQQVPEGFQQQRQFGEQTALPWQMKQQTAPAPGAIPLPTTPAPAPARPDLPSIPLEDPAAPPTVTHSPGYAGPALTPTSAARRKGGQELLRIANLLHGLGHRKAAQVIMATTDVVAALENLYDNKKTRKASQDKTARKAMGIAILATLGITEVLRNTKKAGLRRAADDVDLSLIQALTYPRE